MTSLEIVIGYGLAVDRPAAASSPIGMLYKSTDTGTVQRNNGASWDDYGAGSAAPSGAAGGVLGGTYPNPSFAADMATQAELDAAIAANATADRARANHTGTQLAATVSDFDTQVRLSTLNQMTAPTADLSVNSHKLTNVTDPTSAQDAATKAYVDALARGLDWKASVRAATTAAGTLATSFENGDTIDGVALATGDRILIKDQASGAENGIYTVNASGAPTRAVDADASAEVTAGAAMFVSEGTANQNTAWVLTTDDPIVLGTTALVFAQLSGGALASHNHTASGGDGGILTNDEHDGFAEFAEMAAPSTPSSGKVRIYPKADGLFYSKDDAGVETLVSGGAGGGGGSALTVEEVDGSPTDSAITKIVFPNNTLGIAAHVATYTPAGGSGVADLALGAVAITANTNNTGITNLNYTDFAGLSLTLSLTTTDPFDLIFDLYGWDWNTAPSPDNRLQIQLWDDTAGVEVGGAFCSPGDVAGTTHEHIAARVTPPATGSRTYKVRVAITVAPVSTSLRFLASATHPTRLYARATKVSGATPIEGPKFHVHKNSTDQTLIANNTFTKVTWSTELFDTNNNFASDKFTPTVAGKYQLGARLLVSLTGGTNSTALAAIYKNGTKIKEGRDFLASGSAAALCASVDALVEANGTTDYFEIFLWHNAGVGQTASVNGDQTQSYFYGFMVPTDGAASALIVREVDGSPSDASVTELVFPNNTLGIASHVATYTPRYADVILDYTEATDLFNNGAITIDTWAQLIANQSFTIAASGRIQVNILGTFQVTTTGGSTTIAGARAIIDSGGTPITRHLNSMQGNSGGVFLGFAGSFALEGLAVGVHTIKIEYRVTGAGTKNLYLRASSDQYEHYHVDVTELP